MSSAASNLVLHIGANTQGLTRGVATAQGAVKRLGGMVARIAPMIGGLSVGMAFGKMARAGEDFNRTMQNSTAIMGELSDVMRNDMRAAAFDVAASTKFGAAEAAEAYYFLASAGMKANAAIAAMPAVANFAQAGNFDLATATDLATDAQKALGMAVDDPIKNLVSLTHVTDVLTKANTIANASSQQFSESLTNKAGAALRVVGKGIEEGTAVLAAWADQGLKGAEAGTALNIVLRDLQTKALANKRGFEAAGVAVFDEAGEMNNLADIVGDLERKLAGMSDAQKKATMLQLGFSDKSMIFIQTLLGSSDAIRKYEQDLRDAGGTTKEVADKQLTPLQKGMAKLGAVATKIGMVRGSLHWAEYLTKGRAASTCAARCSPSVRCGETRRPPRWPARSWPLS